MATSSKFDLSSDSPDRPPYTSGQRGSHLTAQLDRPGSFRESMENPILSSLPNMTRSSSALAQGDVVNFFQCLRFDPKLVAAQHKSNRQGDFKRHLNVTLGISVDDTTSGPSKGKIPAPEEIKRAKAGLRESLRESTIKARERHKIFGEALSVFNKFFPSIPSKKRTRSEGCSNDRPNLLSSDRSIMGSSVGKMGIHNHVVGGGLELDHQKLEERTKNVVPNKRTRTSMLDMRSNSVVRPSGTVDRDREMPRLANSGAVQGDERTLSIGVDGWEKTKMKKKRSGIKPDGASNVAKTNEGYREPKQAMQQRSVADARSRLNSESHGFRPAIANGTVNTGKSNGISQSTGLNARSSIPRADIDSSSLLNDRRERPIVSDKERLNIRAVNKANARDEFNSSSPTSSAKMNASTRGPRSGSGIGAKLSPVIHRGSAPNEWELSHCSNKPPVGVNNRKRTASNRSSSPPVAHWAGQRPQKISRAARRTNLVPIVSNNNGSPSLDTVSDVSGNEFGSGFAKRFTGTSPQQGKLKSEPASSAVLSESEESGAPEIKSKDKGKRSDEMDENAGQNVMKVSTVGLQSRKNKLVAGEDLGDGVRRQGRTGRGFTTRSPTPMSFEKVGNVGTAKQLRSARLGFDRNESKTGRPPTRKLSDRKAYKRQKHTMVGAASDFLVGSDDGHEELLAAASSVIKPVPACPNSIWGQMEPFFRFISDADIGYLKKQGSVESASPSPSQVQQDINNCSVVSNGYGIIEHEFELGISTDTRLSGQSLLRARDIPLYQRLLAAMISEEEIAHGYRDMEFDTYETGLELDVELGSNGLNHVDNFKLSGNAVFNGCKVTGTTEHGEAAIDALGISTTGFYPNFSHGTNGLLREQAFVPSKICPEFEYDDTQITENLCLEVRSIGIYPEPLMEDEGINVEVRNLEEKYCVEVSKKKGLLDNLLKSASETKELQEKEFEQRAHEKLLAMAYEKYMACWGPSAAGGKGSGNKMAKQAALSFVKRTLERYHTYEDTGKSCFSEPLFQDIFRSFHLGDGRSSGTPMDGEFGKLYANASRSMEARVSASLGSQPSPRTSRLCQNGDGYVSSDMLQPINRLSEHSIVKEDTWSNRGKKRELLLDDVGGNIGMSNVPSGIGVPLSSSTKGKRSERDREGKALSRNGTNKIGRPALSNAKGERKSKTKPKQKNQLSVSVNGLLGKMAEQPKPALPSEAKSGETSSRSNGKEKDGLGMDALDDSEALDFSNLQLPGLDDGQGQDLGSWLNIDDDGLQDHDDFMGLEIPMDDLSDLNMMV